MKNKKVASISISGEITLNLHSLNNECGEGNSILTRQLTIVDVNGNQHTVNGISGDMFKHIHAEHLINCSISKNLPLSDYSKILNPNRISSNNILKEFPDIGKEDSNSAEAIDAILKICTVCDTHGFMITDKLGKNDCSPKKKSIIDFGWTIAVPDKNNTNRHIHTKLVADAGKLGSGTRSNEGQNIFHRPVNNGNYAIVCSLDAYRIGYNDISCQYSIDDQERTNRYKAIVESLLYLFLEPNGAMTSSQKPHITNFKGIVTITYDLVPAPTCSAINPDYKEQLIQITENLNNINPNSTEIESFENMGEFSKIISNLIINEPYKK